MRDLDTSPICVSMQVQYLDRHGRTGQLDMELRYDPGQPLAVLAEIRERGQEPIVWRFGRELLAQGLDEPAGLADVRIWPDRDRVRIRLTGEECSILMTAPRVRVEAFVRATQRRVPLGRERVDVDAFLDELLRGAS